MLGDVVLRDAPRIGARLVHEDDRLGGTAAREGRPCGEDEDDRDEERSEHRPSLV
jgi:hypothetical protein